MRSSHTFEDLQDSPSYIHGVTARPAQLTTDLGPLTVVNLEDRLISEMFGDQTMWLLALGLLH